MSSTNKDDVPCNAPEATPARCGDESVPSDPKQEQRILSSQRSWLLEAEADPAGALSSTMSAPVPARQQRQATLQDLDLAIAMAHSPELSQLERHCAMLQRAAENRARSRNVEAADSTYDEVWSSSVLRHDALSTPWLYAVSESSVRSL